MPDTRRHRGPHPQDERLFAPAQWPLLREAVADYSWLLSHVYATVSALKLVGDRYQLAERQRLAVMRSACSESSKAIRRASVQPPAEIAGATLLIDGYNILITVEAALAGGVILRGRDGCYRDIASIHGTFRRVEETFPAIDVLARALTGLRVGACTWYLDSPVSNSGRLRVMLLEAAKRHGLKWQVELVTNPDPILARAKEIIVTSDSVILDQCRQWFNLARYVIDLHVEGAGIVELDCRVLSPES